MTKNVKWPTVLGVLGGAWLLFAVAMAVKWQFAWLGLPLLIALPGWLLIQAFQIPTGTAVRTAVYSVGLSIVTLLGWGWFCNWALQIFGVDQPLGFVALHLQMHVLVAGLLWLVWRRTRERAALTVTWKPLSLHEFAMAATPVALVALAIAGAHILNNGGNAWTTFIMLAGVLVYFGLMIVWRTRMRGSVIAWGLYGTALALLLMTSLRSWFIAGHDIQQEFYVFQLTKDAGLWSMAAFRDAYNACLSITILPTQFAQLLAVPGELVYKALFPALFAFTPVVIYLLVRRFATRFVAILSALYFMSVPTFFADMPMLNRQMIAFLLMSLTLYALFDTRLNITTRRLLAVVFGLGMVVSHYSTTYLFVGILAAALILRWFIMWISGKRWAWKDRLLARSSMPELSERKVAPEYALNATVVAALILGALAWSLSTWVTNPSQLVSNAFNKTVKCVTLNCEAPERSGDTSMSLFGAARPDYGEQLADYKKDVIDPAHNRIPQAQRYPNAAVLPGSVQAVTPAEEPASGLSEALNKVLPFNVVSLTESFHGLMIRLVQLLVIVGAVAVLFWNRFGRRLPTEYKLIALVSLAVVVATVVVPGLSVRYGVLRAFEQSLIISGPLLVIGSMVVFAWQSLRVQRIAAVVIALAFMATTTGALHFVFGGGSAQLHLANRGTYYDTYYTHKDELRAMDWLAEQVKNPETNALVQMDRYAYVKWRAHTGLKKASAQIYPTLIRKNSYVLLGHSNVVNKTSTVFHNGNLITYTYPVNFLDEQKDLMYSSGSARVYR